MNRAPLATEDDLRIVKQFLLAPVLLDVLEHDMNTLNNLQLKMPTVYIQSLRSVQQKINAELVPIRRSLHKRGIKIYETKRTALGVECRFLCRGYHRSFTLLWSLVKAEVEQKLSHILGVHPL